MTPDPDDRDGYKNGRFRFSEGVARRSRLSGTPCIPGCSMSKTPIIGELSGTRTTPAPYSSLGGAEQFDKVIDLVRKAGRQSKEAGSGGILVPCS